MRRQGGFVGKQEQTTAGIKLRTRFNQMPESFCVGGDGQHAETVNAESGMVDVLPPGRLVGQQLPVKAGLIQAVPRHRHGAAISLQKIPAAIEPSDFIGKLQPEHTVWNHSASDATTDFRFPLKRRPPFRGHGRQDCLVRGQEANIRAPPTGDLKRNHDIGNQKGMTEKNPANPILLAPFKPVEGKWQFAFENRRSFTPDSVNHPPRAVLVVINLAAGTFKETVVIKELKPSKDLLLTAGKQRAEVVGTQEPVTVNVF